MNEKIVSFERAVFKASEPLSLAQKVVVALIVRELVAVLGAQDEEIQDLKRRLLLQMMG